MTSKHAPKLIKQEFFCNQNNQLPTKNHNDLKYNSIIVEFSLQTPSY